MRFAIVSQQGGKASGAEHALLEYVELLPKDFEAHWFFFEDGEFARSVRASMNPVTIVNMSDRTSKIARRNLDFRPIFDIVKTVVALARQLRAAKVDVVLTNSMKAHVIGALAAKLAGLRCISYIHDIVDGSALILLRLVSRFCCDERLTCSAAVEAQLAMPRTRTLYATLDMSRFASLPEPRFARRSLGLPDDDVPVIAIVGRIARWKRQDLFIRVAARAAREIDAYFCIVGSPLFGVDTEYMAELERASIQAGLSGRLFFVPWQSDVRVIYAAADLACNCSEREPFGRTSLEALACGVPIVCFSDAGICEIFEHNQVGIKVLPGDEAAFANAIVNIISDRKRRQSMRLAALDLVRKFDSRLLFPIFIAAITRSRPGTRANRIGNRFLQLQGSILPGDREPLGQAHQAGISALHSSRPDDGRDAGAA